MMRLQTFTKFVFLFSFLYVLCLSNQTPFISMDGDCRYPAVASEGDSIYLVWLLVVNANDAGVFFRRSVDGGKQWSTDKRISIKNSLSYPPAIAVKSGVVHAAWIDYGETIDGELYYTRSLDGGETWEKCRILITEANSARFPLLVCKNDHVYMIWQDVENKTYFKASHDNGLTWIGETLLAKLGKHSCYCYPPAIGVNGDEISVVWTDVRKRGFRLRVKGVPIRRPSKKGKNVVYSIVRRKSNDAGHTWRKEQVLVKAKVTKEAQEEIDNPAIITDGHRSYVFWLDKRHYRLGEIFYANMNFRKDRFPVNGERLLPLEKRSPKRPSVVLDKEKRFHLTWASFLTGKSIVYYCQSDPEGNIIIDKKELTLDTGRRHNPVITKTSSGLLNVFWFDEPKEEYSRIFLKTSKDNGITWEDWES
jgi:hypothetical protein